MWLWKWLVVSFWGSDVPMCFFPPKQNAMGSLHNLDFGVFWASWGGSGKESGSGNRFREPKLVPFHGFRQVPVPKVPGPRAAVDMWDQVLTILGLVQCCWQCCAESECICVKGILKPPCCWGDTAYAYFNLWEKHKSWFRRMPKGWAKTHIL